MKKKIAIISPHMEINGAAVMTLDFIEMLDKDQYDIDMYIFKPGDLIESIPSHVNVIMPSNVLKTATIKQHEIKTATQFIRKTVAVLKNKLSGQKYNYYKEKWTKQYDLVVCHTEDEPIFYAMYNFVAKRKIVWIHIEIEKKYANNQDFAMAYDSFDKIVCVSQASADSFRRTFPELEKRVNTVYNRINIERILSLSNDNTENRPCLAQPAIVTVARLNSQKRIDRCVMVARILKDMRVNFNWYIIGDGEPETYHELSKMITDNQLDDQFILYGKTSNPYYLINQATVCALLSDFEGYATFINEARILKKAIVATDFTAIEEQIINNKSGMIVDRFDHVKIAQSIALLLQDEKLRHSMSTAITLDETHNQAVLAQTLQLLDYD